MAIEVRPLTSVQSSRPAVSIVERFKVQSIGLEGVGFRGPGRQYSIRDFLIARMIGKTAYVPLNCSKKGVAI